MIDDFGMLWQVEIPCSRQLVEDMDTLKFQALLDSHAGQVLLESVMERCPDRYFVAHMTNQEMCEDFRAKRKNIVWVVQHWRVTFH